jgi:hypothetical protein
MFFSGILYSLSGEFGDMNILFHSLQVAFYLSFWVIVIIALYWLSLCYMMKFILNEWIGGVWKCTKCLWNSVDGFSHFKDD